MLGAAVSWATRPAPLLKTSSDAEEAVRRVVFTQTSTIGLRETNERVARQSFQTVPSRVAGVLSLADPVKPESAEAVRRLMAEIPGVVDLQVEQQVEIERPGPPA